MPSFEFRSQLNVTPEQFWSIMSIRSVNEEFGPLITMTAPAQWRDVTIERWQTSRLLFQSWILLFGVLPVDRHAFHLLEVNPGRGFVESSSSWVNRVWRHERTTSATSAGCIVSDRLTITGRLPWLTALMMPTYRLVFHVRHSRLRKRFGGVPVAVLS